MKILVTGGAGFIGSATVRYLTEQTENSVINVDKLTYAGNLESLASVQSNPRYAFEQVDICNKPDLQKVFSIYQPNAVIHLAAETHVDKSIDGPGVFIQSNIVGTYTLLEVVREYWDSLEVKKKTGFRFHHVSTDEVYGDLASKEQLFSEVSAYKPSSPYSASKAASDHLVRAWHRTYGLPVIISNCTNNYGPNQHPEKLIPLMISRALAGKPLPIYGNGKQIRDWLHVDDHVCALYKILTQGRVGETYTVSAHNEKTNREVVQMLCQILERLVPEKPDKVSRYEELIEFVADRPGHDVRYGVDASKIMRELDWKPEVTFAQGMLKTVESYLSKLS